MQSYVSIKPCDDQTPEQIEHYYRNVKPGDEVAIRETQYGHLRYYITIVDRTNRGRVYPKGHQSFFMKSGAMCREPYGQCKLVVPTQAVKDYAAQHPAERNLSYSAWEPNTGPATLEEAREKLAQAEANLKRLNEAWENYSGNNPNKYRSDIKSAQLSVSVYRSWVEKYEREQTQVP